MAAIQEMGVTLRGMPRSRLLLILLAAAVLAGSAVLRFTGIHWLLPSLVEQDPPIPVPVRPMGVLACMRLRRRGGVAEYALAGVSVAAAIACLQSGLATLLPLAAAHVGVVRERGRSRHALLLVPLACVALACIAFYPFLFEPGSS